MGGSPAINSNNNNNNNNSSILAIANHRNWLDDSPPLRLELGATFKARTLSLGWIWVVDIWIPERK